MKLWLIKAQIFNYCDTYDSAVVAAQSEHQARNIHPRGNSEGWDHTTWASPSDVIVEYVGSAKPGTKAGTVICASFNAG